jgi:hypothetical protein
MGKPYKNKTNKIYRKTHIKSKQKNNTEKIERT